jgi:hypothetical protein
MGWFYPIRTGQTFFDVWSIFHLAFWVFMGSNFWAAQKFIERPRAMLVGLCLAYGWELFERYAEHKWPDVWLTPESHLNSYVSDPLTCVLGMLFAWYALDHWRV